MTTRHTSRLAASWVADTAAPPWREFDGAAVLADVSGFTSLTERLAGTGAEGAEVLHRVMTLCFTTLLDRAVELGGDIITFAGDAALVWFDGVDHVERAVEAAAAMPAGLASLPASATGGRRLRVSVGVNSGTFQAVLAGTTQRDLFLCGPQTSLLAKLEAAAAPGQVLVGPSVAERLPRSRCGMQIGPGVLLRGRPAGGLPAVTPSPDPPATTDLRSFAGPGVLDLLDAGVTMGDHRTVSAGFVLVPGLDDLLRAGGLGDVHAVIDDVVNTVTRVTRELSVDWLDSDVGAGSVKLLLTAGAPRSVDHDEERLLLALRRIIDECDHPVRAGAQRGPMFSAPLGIDGRFTYTILGDAVNVAARAMALAGDRELIAADGLGVDQLALVTATALGPQQLKNRAAPVEMWRIDAMAKQRHLRRSTAASITSRARRHEAQMLAAAWKETVEGQGCVVSVVGEPGMGASELLAEVTDLAGGTATAVAAHPFQRRVPYAALASAVRAVAEGAGADVGDGGWSWLAAFAPRLPSHLRRWADQALATASQTASGNVDPQTTARRTQLVLVALLGEAMPSPWLLTIDDVDRVDDASRQVFAQLRELTTERPLMLVTSSALGAPPFGSTFPGGVTINLAPVPDGEARELVADLAPSLRRDEVERVVTAANGNPLVLSELARQPRGGELPDSLQRLGAALIDTLSAPASALVRDVSLFGTSAPVDLVADVLGRPELRARASWSDTEPVVRLTAANVVEFRHDAYRRVAYDSLPFQRRRELHGRIADLLSAQPKPNPALLALHLQRAGRVADAYPLAVAAGHAAKAAGALVEAADLLGRAAQMAREVDPAAVAELLLDRGEALVWLGDLSGAAACYRSATRTVGDPLTHGRLCHLQADLALTDRNFRRARRWAERGLSVTDPCGDATTELRCRLLLDLAARLDLSGQHRESLPVAVEALTTARAASNRLVEGLAHVHLEMAYGTLKDVRAVEHGDAAVAIFEEIGHDRYLTHALINSGLTAMHLGRWNEAVDRYQRGIVHARICGHTLNEALAEMNLGFLRYRQGHLQEADGQARRAQQTFEASGVTGSVAYALILRGQVAAAEARYHDAEVLVAAARAAFAEVDDAELVADCDATALEHLLMQGRAADVVARGRQLQPVMAATETEVMITFGRVLGRAEAMVGTAGREGEGVTRVERALALARSHQLPYDVYRCLSALVAIADDGGPPVPDTLRQERAAIAAHLGLTDPAES